MAVCWLPVIGHEPPMLSALRASIERPVHSGSRRIAYGSISAVAAGHAAPIERRQRGGHLPHGAQCWRTAGFLFIELELPIRYCWPQSSEAAIWCKNKAGKFCFSRMRHYGQADNRTHRHGVEG